MPRVSVIMPAYNESAGIYRNIATTAAVLADAGLDAEIVAVDDGSADRTLSEIERATADLPHVIAARNPYNMGKGMALRTGFDHATGEIIVFLDADLDLHPSQILSLIDVLDAGPYDAVVTSKHHPDSRLSYPFQRQVASWGYYLIIKALFGLPVRDTQTGLKIFRREVLDMVFHCLLVKRYAYDVELLAAAVRFGFRVHEVPVVLEFRRQQVWGRIRFGDVMKLVVDTLAVFYRLRILKYYDVERPPWPRGETPVLVIIRGAPPDEAIIRRLTVDTRAVVSCLMAGSAKTDVPGVTQCFRSLDDVRAWLAAEGEGRDIRVVGFLGADCTPVGSWVKNAVRNFQDPDVRVVCGPVVPVPVEGLRSRVAGMLATSILTTGPDARLRSIRRVAMVNHSLVDNMFLTVEALSMVESGEGFRQVDGYLAVASDAAGTMKYDPDVALSRLVRPLFASYYEGVAGEASAHGRRFARGAMPGVSGWPLVSIGVWVFLLAGWVLLPGQVYTVGVACLVVAGLVAVLLYFDPAAVPVFIPALALDHLVRACAFIAGMTAGLFSRRSSTSS